MTSEPTTPKNPRRRFWRWSMRTVLLAAAVFCVWFGWVGYEAREQKKVVEWVEDKGGILAYDYMFYWNPAESDTSPKPIWLARFLGTDYFHDVFTVSFWDTQVSDLTPLAGLNDLRWLTLVGTPVSDLTPLARLPSLQKVRLENTQVCDVTPLAGLKNLDLLILKDSPVSEEQVEELRKALPSCDIQWSPES